jgi:hypothetical protein
MRILQKYGIVNAPFAIQLSPHARRRGVASKSPSLRTPELDRIDRDAIFLMRLEDAWIEAFAGFFAETRLASIAEAPDSTTVKEVAA